MAVARHAKTENALRARGLRVVCSAMTTLRVSILSINAIGILFVVDNYNRVKQVGFRKHLEEEEERAKAGVDLMGHLERRCCKVVKLEDE